MNIIELNHIDLNSIGLNSKVINGVGKSHGGKVKPYIKGHVTDGSSTFTFTVNGNESITVPVDSNGNWKWAVDRTVTSLYGAFASITNIDIIEINKIDTIKSLANFCNVTSALEKITFKKCDLSGVTSADYAFRNCTKLTDIIGIETLSPTTASAAFASSKINSIHSSFFKNFTRLGDAFYNTPIEYADISQAELEYIRNTFNYSQLKTLVLGNVKSGMEFSGSPFGTNLENIIMADGKTIEGDVTITSTSKLTKQSIVNLFNAVAADGITLTFHQNVWNMIMREIDIQGSPIQVAYQNMIDNYDVTIANASFDAEIEYLESDGTQYIDTEFKANTTTTKIETQLKVNELGSTIGVMGSRNTAAATDATSCNIFLMSDNKFRLDWVDGAGSKGYNNVIDSEKYTISMTRGLAIINGTEITASNTESINQNGNFLIFRFYRGSAPSPSSFKGRFYYFKIYSNNVLVRDLIPVRKGTTGYMYDKVSGNLFGNSGTGDFILGNDK